MTKPAPIITEQAEPAATPQRSRYRPAIIVSVVVHLVLAAVLLFWYLPKRNQADSETRQASATAPASQRGESQKPPPPEPVADVPNEQIEKSVQSQIEQVKQLPDEKKLSELEKNLRRLDAIANPESVEDVSGKIASTLGLNTEQYQPKATPAAGVFDANTAQLQDVTRTRSASGMWQYESVLVDAGGRTMKVPMSAAEGETVYNTFEQMKKFPLAQGIYRSVVMPLIQKMLSAEDAASKASIAAERLQQNDQAAQGDYQVDE
jgi:hypothetical protein